MNVENNWITTNIKNIVRNNSIPFSVTINKYPYTKLPFLEACENVCHKISALNKPIYIAYSGGMDSEFVIDQFKQHGIPFTSITCIVPNNWIEFQYAKNYYRKNPDIQKIVLKTLVDYKDLFKKFYQLVKKFNSPAINSLQILECANYVKSQNGILVIGDHLMGRGYNPVDNVMMVGTSEWDHYCDIIDEDLVVPFFYYDLPITEAFVSQFNTMEADHFKEYMYKGISYRPKIVPDYNNLEKTKKVFNTIVSTIKPKANRDVNYTKEQFLSMI